MKHNKKLVTIMVSMMLMAALVFSAAGCGSKNETVSTETTVYEDGAVIGEGDNVFNLTIVNGEQKEITVEVHTDEETVGAALMDCGILAGEDGPYGLYIKTVNGDTYDYEEDGKYWAFYINGEYGMTGVDVTPVTAGDSYALKAEE